MIPDKHQVLAPTLLRSQLLTLLYQAVQSGEVTKKDAERRLNYARGLRIRLLGDRVLQNVAWKVADQLGWPDTFAAESVALDDRAHRGIVLIESALRVDTLPGGRAVLTRLHREDRR